MNSLTFLGTGGGRFVLLNQRRYSGGLWLDLGAKMILDPGPGALIRALQFKKKPHELDSVLVSHKHLDHYNDAEVMIEAMTYGTKKDKGVLAINKNALDYISEYHRKAVTVIIPKAGEEFTVEGVKVKAIPTFKHEGGVGFKFFTEDGVITYSADTGYSTDLVKDYMNSKILILNVIFPRSKKLESHLNTDDAAAILEGARPEIAIIQHFGVTMLNADPEKEAAFIEEKTGVKTIAARDGMTISLEDIGSEEKQLRLSSF